MKNHEGSEVRKAGKNCDSNYVSPEYSVLPLLLIHSCVSEYQTTVNNTQKCSYKYGRENENAVCDVDINSWGDCKPNGTYVPNVCIYFKINKVSKRQYKQNDNTV
jgi:hypothetical protein